MTPQPEQTPIGTVKELFTQAAWERLDLKGSTEVYITQPQRTWVGLTEDERNEILINAVHHKWDDRKIVKDIEDKLKEKNNGQ